MPYDPKTVPRFNIKEASLGPVDIKYDSNAFVLYNKGDQWMVFNHKQHDEIKEMWSSYDLAYGDVLVSGLGFGILALWLCSKPEVTSVTVVEISNEVIEIFKQSNSIPDKLTIINEDILSFGTNKKYDSLLLDHYERQNFDWRLKNMKEICEKIEHDVFWAWSLEQVFTMKECGLDARKIINVPTENTIFKYKPDFSQKWHEFVSKYFPNEKVLPMIELGKINEYIYTYFNKQDLLD